MTAMDLLPGGTPAILAATVAVFILAGVVTVEVGSQKAHRAAERGGGA